mmetsp:Transcript_313/g.880  ORF Transcript_313/g.880 Transcript_313/m.880 type:complete len:319 (+) Transcript_313:1602-2558(+)
MMPRMTTRRAAREEAPATSWVHWAAVVVIAIESRRPRKPRLVLAESRVLCRQATSGCSLVANPRAGEAAAGPKAGGSHLWRRANRRPGRRARGSNGSRRSSRRKRKRSSLSLSPIPSPSPNRRLHTMTRTLWSCRIRPSTWTMPRVWRVCASAPGGARPNPVLAPWADVGGAGTTPRFGEGQHSPISPRGEEVGPMPPSLLPRRRPLERVMAARPQGEGCTLAVYRVATPNSAKGGAAPLSPTPSAPSGPILSPRWGRVPSPTAESRASFTTGPCPLIPQRRGACSVLVVRGTRVLSATSLPARWGASWRGGAASPAR